MASLRLETCLPCQWFVSHPKWDWRRQATKLWELDKTRASFREASHWAYDVLGNTLSVSLLQKTARRQGHQKMQVDWARCQTYSHGAGKAEVRRGCVDAASFCSFLPLLPSSVQPPNG